MNNANIAAHMVLAPCPFCGDDGEKGRQEVTQMNAERNKFVRIICHACGCMCPEHNWNARAALAAQPGAVGEWKRVPVKATPEMIEAMRQFIKWGWSDTENGSRPMSMLYAELLAAAPTEAKPAQDAVDAERWRFAMDWGNFDWAVCRIDGDRYEQIENNEPIDAAISAKKV